jgi:hypothetical protein
MISEHIGIWVSKIGEPEHPYMIVKLPQVTLKAIYTGCRVALIFTPLTYKEKSLLTYGLAVWDAVENPLISYQLIKHENEFLSIRNCMAKKTVRVHFFDELARPIYSSTASFNSNNLFSYMNSIYDFIDISNDDDIYENYKHVIESEIKKDDGCGLIDLKFIFDEPNRIVIPCVGRFSIDEKDEGRMLQDSVFHIIESMYSLENSVSSPSLDNFNKREFTDILSWDSHHVCFIESKCLTILGRGEIDTSKRIKNINKHLSKALNQLEGVVRTYRRNEKIFDRNHKVINIPHNRNSGMIDCIVLLSEMFPFLEWEDIAKDLIDRANRIGAFFHVLDLAELQRLVALSKNSTVFNANLYIRWEKVRDSGTAFVKGFMAPTDGRNENIT